MIPPEITDRIIDFLHGDHDTLRSCSLTCSEWLPSARFHLFYTLVLSNAFQLSKYARLLKSAPHVGHYVRSLKMQYYSNDITLDVCRHFSNLTKFELSCDIRNFETFLSLLTCFPLLKHLHFQYSDFPISDIGTTVTAVPQSVELLWLRGVSFEMSKFMEWAIGTGLFQRIRTFGYTPRFDRDRENILGICTFFKCYGQNLVHLDLLYLSTACSDGECGGSFPGSCRLNHQFHIEFFEAFGCLVNLERFFLLYPYNDGISGDFLKRSSHPRNIPQFFHRITSHSINRLVCVLRYVGLSPPSQDFDASFTDVWRDVAEILSDSRFVNLTKFTLQLDEFLRPKEEVYFAPLPPLRTRGVLSVQCMSRYFIQ